MTTTIYCNIGSVTCACIIPAQQGVLSYPSRPINFIISIEIIPYNSHSFCNDIGCKKLLAGLIIFILLAQSQFMQDKSRIISLTKQKYEHSLKS